MAATMRALILLVSAFLTAFAGAGTVVHAGEASSIVAAASEVSLEKRERVATRFFDNHRPSIKDAARLEPGPAPDIVAVPIYASRRRI